MSRPPVLDVDDLPAIEGRPVAVRIDPAAERALRDGHPWLFEGSVASESRTAAAGEVAVVFDRKDRFLAAGLYDPEGPIRVRLLVHREPEEIGPDLFRSRVSEALGRRSGVASRTTTAFRVLHGENDRMAGLVVDLYDRTLVLDLHSVAWTARLRELLPVFSELLAPERVLLLASRRVASSAHLPPSIGRGAVLAGAGPANGISFLETGLRFEAHPFQGHKTGFYLDQRENRRRLEGEVEEGCRVLNVFSYSGGFALYAARGGAEEVVCVDRAGPALAQAWRHFELNREDSHVSGCRHRTLEDDAFAALDRLGDRGETFDVVVLDPPSFASAAEHRDRALRAYGRLTSLALPLLVPGGLLVQASCSSRVDAGSFFSRIHRVAASAGRPLEEVRRTGHPPDHPVGFPEGAYLKCLWARVP